MAASAGVMKLIGASGRTYTVDIYIPDAVATFLTWNPQGLAGTGSPTFWILPESATIVDISTSAAPTAVGFTLQGNGASIAGGVCRWTNQLSTNTNRIPLNVPLSKGVQLSALQF